MTHIPVDFSWKQGDFTVFLPTTLALVTFIIYWFTYTSEKIRLKFFQKSDFDKASLHYIIFRNVLGFFMMGVIPFLLTVLLLPEWTPATIGLTYNPSTAIFSLVWILILCALVIPLMYFSSRKPAMLAMYPLIRAKNWTSSTVFWDITGWALYLFGYELLFRGVLLFPLVSEIGVWPAIAVNIALYSSTHIPKGLSEALGAIPLGLIFCILTLLSGTFWIAFLVHLAMALTNSITAFRYNPDMHFRKQYHE